MKNSTEEKMNKKLKNTLKSPESLDISGYFQSKRLSLKMGLSQFLNLTALSSHNTSRVCFSFENIRV